MAEKNLHLKSILVIMIAAMAALVLFVFFYVFPKFDHILLTFLEKEAVSAAQHIDPYARKILAGEQLDNEHIETEIQGFHLLKIRFFAANGDLLFSTGAEKVRDHSFSPSLLNTLKRDGIVSELLKEKRGRTGDVVTAAEVYLPISDGDIFLGFVEIYQDVSSYHKQFAGVKIWAAFLMLSSVFITTILLYFLISRIQSSERESGLAHKQLRTAINALPDTFLVIDRNYRIVMANSAVHELAGVDPVAEKLCCHHVSHHQNVPCTGDDDPCPLPMVLETGKPVTVIHKHFNAQGDEHWVEITASPIFNEQGEVIQMIEACKDVTEQKIAEEDLLKSKQKTEEANRQLQKSIVLANELAVKAEQANISKSEFLANMSHEIRTPMNGVVGMADLLAGTGLGAEQADYVETIRKSANALLYIINDLLDFSKIEAGKLDLESVPFDLADLIDDVGDIVAIRAQEKGLEYNCMLVGDVPLSLVGDPGRLRQIMINLVGNSIKFTETGEVTVRIEAEMLEADQVVIRFDIYDTGVGIAGERIKQLFDPFVQADESTTRKFGGTGLGLSICKRLVAKMDGEIGVDSLEDEGTYFWFTARFDVDNEVSKLLSPPVADPQKYKILVVEENDASRQVMVALLHKWQFDCDEVLDSDTALTLLTEAVSIKPYDLVVICLGKAENSLDGLADKVATELMFAKTRMILISPKVRGCREKCKLLGVMACLDKPIKRYRLHDCLSAVLTGETWQAGSLASEFEMTDGKIANGKFEKCKVLLAEDNYTNQKVALGLLRKFGVSTDVVGNGNEAVEAVKTGEYDLVFMDCQMPEMDGFGATKIIRSLPGVLANLPIIAMTAHALTGDREKCLAAGMDDYITKPINHQVVWDALQKFLPDTGGNNTVTESGNVRMMPESVPERDVAANIFDRVDLIARLMDDEELACEVVVAFLEDMPGKIEELKRVVGDGAFVEIKDNGHGVKGAARNISAHNFQKAALLIEEAGSDEDQERAVSLLPALDKEWAVLEKVLRGFIA